MRRDSVALFVLSIPLLVVLCLVAFAPQMAAADVPADTIHQEQSAPAVMVSQSDELALATPEDAESGDEQEGLLHSVELERAGYEAARQTADYGRQNVPAHSAARSVAPVSVAQAQPEESLVVSHSSVRMVQVAAEEPAAVPAVVQTWSPVASRSASAEWVRAADALSVTLDTLNLAAGSNANTSSFVFTNVNEGPVFYTLDFFWPNGYHVGDDGFELEAGGSHPYDLSSAPFAHAPWFGYVEISGADDVEAAETSDEWGWINGIILDGSDGITPVEVNNVHLERVLDGENFGDIYNLPDGRFYLGGLPDDDYRLWVNARYPFASQYYNNQLDWEQADAITISGAGETAITVTLQAGGRFTGTVYADDGTTPLPNVNVDMDNGGYGTCTDENGQFVLEGAPYGEHILYAGGDWNWCLEDSSPYMREYYNEADNPESATLLELSGLQDSYTDLDFTLSTGGSITGRVTDAGSGLGVENVHVEAAPYFDQPFWLGAMTDASGYYTITGLADGDWRVQVSDSNWLPEEYAFQYYPDTIVWEEAGLLTISDSGEVADVDFALHPGGTIRGQVQAESGGALENIHVNAGLVNYDYGVGTCSGSDGSYELHNMPFTDYKLEAGGGWNWCQEAASEYAREYYDNVLTWDEATQLALDAGSTPLESIDFTLEPAGSILGRVTDDEGVPLANINVGAGLMGTEYGEGACTDDQGYFALNGLPYGDWVVDAAGMDNWCTGETSDYIQLFYDNVDSYDQATPIGLDSGNDWVENIDFSLYQGGRITGRVTDASTSDPLADVWVWASEYSEGWYGRGAYTDASGYYTITGLLDLDYRIQVDSELPAGYAQQFYPDQFAHHLADPVHVPVGVTVSDIDFHLVPGGAITGVIVDADTGSPIPYLSVSAGLVDDEGGAGRCTGLDGSFVLDGLIYGDYKVQAGGQWNDCMNEPGVYAAEFYGGEFLWRFAPSITVDGPTPVTDVNLDLDEGGVISGTITQTGGAPVVGLQVEAVMLNGDCLNCQDGYMGTETGPDGSYTLGPTPPVGVAVYACTDCTNEMLVAEYYDDVLYLSQATFITATGGTVAPNVNIELDPGVLLTGTVTVPSGYNVNQVQIQAWQNEPDGYGTGRQVDGTGFYAIPVPPIFDSSWTVAAQPWGTDLAFEWASDFDLSRYTNWDFDLDVGGTISGRITNDGAPVPYVSVHAGSPWMNHGVNTDEDGYYTISQLPAGEYRIETDPSPEYAAGFYGGHAYEYATLVPLDPEELYANADFEVGPMAQIEGTVTESNGSTPIEGVRVDAISDEGIWTAWTQSNGYYTIDLPAGDYRVRYYADWDFWARVPIFYDNSTTYRDADVVSATAGSPVLLDVSMDETAVVQGQVTEAGSGTPVEGVHVAVMNVDPAVNLEVAAWSDCTNENGEYHIEKVWPGENEVMAIGTCSGQDYGLITDTVTATAGGEHTVDLEVVPDSAGERPFTIRTADSYDYTPLSSGGIVNLKDVDHILPALYTPLVELDDENQWTSELLVSLPTISNGGAAIVGDQLVVTYTLKPGLLWSDGEPLTSADIRFSWEMMTQYAPGQDAWLAQVDPLWLIDGVVTPDALTAVVTFKREHIPPAYLGAITYLLPEHELVGEHRLDVQWNSNASHYPVGNGPYVVTDFVPGSHIDLTANPNYHLRSSGLPAISEVRFLFTNHPDYAFMDGSADVTLHADVQRFRDNDVPVVEIVDNGFRSIVPNTDLPFFADAAVRQALYTALDRDGFAADYTGESTLVGADSYLTPGHPMAGGTLTSYDFDLTDAATMLTAAGWVDTNSNGTRDKDGVEFEFNLVYNEGNDLYQELAMRYQEDLAAIGVDANVVSVPWEELLKRARLNELDAYLIGWYFDSRYDPMGYDLWHSSVVPTAYNRYEGTQQNHWADPDPSKTDAWMEAARSELDPAALQNYTAQHLERYTDQLPTFSFAHTLRGYAHAQTLLNFSPGPMTPATWNIAQWDLIDNPWDLTVRTSLAPDSPAPQPDSTIIYQIKVQNLGALAVTNATLIDVLPDELVFVSATPAPDVTTDHTLTWNLGDLAGGESLAAIRVTADIPATVLHNTRITNTVEVFGDQSDTFPENNGYIHQVTVRDDVDLAIKKRGVGLPAIGADYTYYLDYANWGGAPATGVVITDVLPPEVHLTDAVPAPSVDGQTLTWTIGNLPGNQWGGQIKVFTEIDAAGTVTNTAELAGAQVDVDLDNNSDDHVDEVDSILPPILTQPTQGVTDETPTFKGLAPSESTVEIWNLDSSSLIASTTATISGTFEVEVSLTPGTYFVAATATKDALISDYSNSATFDVQTDLPLDTDGVSITTNGAVVSQGVIRAQRRTLSMRLLQIDVVIDSATEPDAELDVTENGLFNYQIPPVAVTSLGDGQWLVQFRLWLSEIHSTYDIWVDWESSLGSFSELLLFVLIDPDGYVYDQSMVDAGATITDSILTDGTVTCYVWQNDAWEVWPAEYYGQINPQVTDGATADGVTEPGYYSFLTPPGQYRIEAEVSGFQPYESPVLTVINDPIHLDIGMEPVVGGSGINVSPALLSTSAKYVSQSTAALGDVLTYTVTLRNTGGESSGTLVVSDPLPEEVEYVADSLNWNNGTASYNAISRTVVWTGTVAAGGSEWFSFQAEVVSDAGAPFDLVNVASATGPAPVVATLPALRATTGILAPDGWALYLPLMIQ